MITEIGIVAGEIWHHLDQKGEVTLFSMLDNISRHRDLMLMSMGWLAREGHIVLTQEKDNNYKVKLRRQ